MWCRALARRWTLVPTPILAVEPKRNRTCPLRARSNRSSFCPSVLASWMKAISLAGTPRATSMSRMAA